MEAAIDLADAMEARGEGFGSISSRTRTTRRRTTRRTGPEIWRDTRGPGHPFRQLDGYHRHHHGHRAATSRQQNPAIQIVGVQPEEGSSIPGIRRWPEAYLPKIYDPAGVDRIIDVSQELAEQTARDLAAREGIFGGVSSGGAVAAALRLCRARCSGAVIVAIVCDRGDRYLSTGVFPA